METITQKEIGYRIAGLRKRKGYSQDDLAILLGIARPSISHIESGKRNLSALELKRITDILSVNIDKLLSDDYKLVELPDESSKEVAKAQEIRVSVPVMNLNKFKNILLYILEKTAGKANVGETVLYKLLYFSDFNYYEMYEEHLSGSEYRKLPYGPVPQKLDSIISQMIDKQYIKRINVNYHGYPQKRYLPLVKPDLSVLKASEKDVIDRVIDQFSDWSATSISDFSHKDIPWLASKDGETIDYELAFYREAPYSIRNYDKNEEEL